MFAALALLRTLPPRPPKLRIASPARTAAGGLPSSARGPILALALLSLAGVAFAAFRLDAYADALGRRGKEAELLLYGRAYMHAIESFRKAVPGEGARYPQSFQELTGDPRLAGRRHLRRLYKDPMTGQEFQAIRNETGGIVGVVSASTAPPFRKEGFERELAGFDNAPTYRDWLFQAAQPAPEAPANREPKLAAATPPKPAPAPAQTAMMSR
jgi:hypothetical protein